MDFKDYYSALGVARDASDDDIRKAYRKLARKYHPDVSKEADADAKMREINEARDVLQDKEKRAAYDQLADHVARGGSPDGGFRQPPPGWDEGFEFHRGPNAGPADHADFSEFFSSIFGNRGGMGGGAQRGPYRERGEDHHAAIEISLEDALHGAERQLTLRAQEIDAQGRPHLCSRTWNGSAWNFAMTGELARAMGRFSGTAWYRTQTNFQALPGTHWKAFRICGGRRQAWPARQTCQRPSTRMRPSPARQAMK